jgi:hypothetical protein
MNDTQLPSIVHPLGEANSQPDSSVALDTFGGRLHVEWEPQAAVTSLGQLPFFVEFLKTAELFEPWIEDCPLEYCSPNAPRVRDVLGTVLLSVLAGHRRYSHISAIRVDGVNPALLGMSKVVSEDSVRRAFRSVEGADCADWQRGHLRRCYEALLSEPWILDVDTTIKPLYGHQEGAVVGYNPHKPGRPSHTYHTYFIANLRLVLDVEVQPGNRTAAKYTSPGLFAFFDSLPRERWPLFMRADNAFGNENVMAKCEERQMEYLFKLRQTKKVRDLIEKVFSRNDWEEAGKGWEGVESSLRLTGWSRRRRVVVLRREVKENLALESKSDNGQLEFAFVETLERVKKYEYAVLVTSLRGEVLTIAQHYRDRGDAENPFDELKNHWGWGGFTTQDLKRCQIMARHTALIYNWWSLFVRLAIPEKHTEAMTSRPLLLHAVAKQVSHGRQKTLRVSISHAQSSQVEEALRKLTGFFARLRSNAEQLDWQARWRLILSRVYVKYLGGRVLGAPRALPAGP